jgi:hypothetical protein
VNDTGFGRLQRMRDLMRDQFLTLRRGWLVFAFAERYVPAERECSRRD